MVSYLSIINSFICFFLPMFHILFPNLPHIHLHPLWNRGLAKELWRIQIPKECFLHIPLVHRKNRKHSIGLYSLAWFHRKVNKRHDILEKFLAGKLSPRMCVMGSPVICVFGGKVAIMQARCPNSKAEHQSYIFHVVLPKAISSYFLWFLFLQG